MYRRIQRTNVYLFTSAVHRLTDTRRYDGGAPAKRFSIAHNTRVCPALITPFMFDNY